MQIARTRPLAEFRTLLDSEAEVVEVNSVDSSDLKEVVLLLDWKKPLHVVVVVDEAHEEERLITVYEPTADRSSDDFRTRR